MGDQNKTKISPCSEMSKIQSETFKFIEKGGWPQTFFSKYFWVLKKLSDEVTQNSLIICRLLGMCFRNK